jgi:hypothetical protein
VVLNVKTQTAKVIQGHLVSKEIKLSRITHIEYTKLWNLFFKKNVKEIIYCSIIVLNLSTFI